MDIDEVGIPIKVAMAMTVPVRVTPQNIEELTLRVINGPDNIFGAEMLTTSNGVILLLHIVHIATKFVYSLLDCRTLYKR